MCSERGSVRTLDLVGRFLHSVATKISPQVAVQDWLGQVPVAQLMQPCVTTVPPNIPIHSLVHEYILGTDERAFPVIDNHCLVGLVCIQDVRKVPDERWDTTEVGEIMTAASQLVLARPEEDARDALYDLAQRDVNQLPVVQDGQLVGMLHRRDILRWLQLHSQRPDVPRLRLSS